ncbi:glycosyltransferase family 4 protein [Pseudoflavitalea sp. G-6-1-2]|uniref:glycosyltransferase family 4 protein n=1 Tax=Pseudoflavitalea sp. G-6-1-2 TaxID=2728841 RepID=UPI00146F0F51|nr:glycosyltransferase family 4 protein [Pseudoflavitalea sp. G-6-1-2]NML20612.1 glycosyltransferase family 4 protein [Pseudoflavitalea sp. G-6-1-2]
MNKAIVDSKDVNEAFDCRILELRFVENLADISKPSFKKVWVMIVIFFKLLSSLIRWRPQLVYFTLAPLGAAFYRDAIYIALIKCFGVRIAYHLHGVGIKEGAEKSAIKRRVAKFIFRNSSVISLAKVLQADIEAVYEGPVPFIQPNSIPNYNFPEKMPSGKPVFLFLSNLIKDKGIYTFLDALKMLHSRNVDFKALIVGAPFNVTIEDVRQKIQEYNLTGKVEVPGPLYGNDKLQIISNADVLVSPTKNDTYPLVILEAMQAGKAVIASNIGAISEMIDDGETGFVIPSCEDAAGFAEKMEVLANNVSLSRAMGEKGRQKFLNRYTMKTYEANEVSILNQILN